MSMKNPPHPGKVVRVSCLEPLGLNVTEGASHAQRRDNREWECAPLVDGLIAPLSTQAQPALRDPGNPPLDKGGGAKRGGMFRTGRTAD